MTRRIWIFSIAFALALGAFFTWYERQEHPDMEGPPAWRLAPAGVRAGVARSGLEDARQLHEAGRLSEAIELLTTSAERSEPHVDAEVLVELCSLLLERVGEDPSRTDDLARASVLARRAISHSPSNWMGHYKLACASSLSGDVRGVVGNLKTAIEIGAEPVRAMAIDDPCLEPMRDRVEVLSLLKPPKPPHAGPR